MADMEGTRLDAAAASLPHVARLASAFARPLDTVDPAGWGLPGLPPSEIRALARDPHFARALARRACGGSLPLGECDAAGIGALAATSEGRLAVLLASRPVGEIEQTALLAAAAALQLHVLRATARAERQRLREALGREPYQVATQEAPTLYADLAKLDVPGSFREMMAADEDAAALRARLLAFGHAVLCRFAAAAAPALSGLVARRLPSAPLAAPFDNHKSIDLKQLSKLICRRMPGWADIIG